ncbi:MAG: lipopolysaccharide heptosyltransferase II [Ignavibacteriae bacterium]|nr:lipopolysaccharide heptosyltransferase II [Ignavibacteriota bacterium]MCB9216277.1 lipopolysaccharide heptosyltransferase II [Ignavibacteria bacterium]
MIESALIVQPGFLGDAVLATGLLRLLHNLSPTTNVGLLVRSEYSALFAKHPALGSLHAIDKRSADDWRRVREEIRSCHYDLALIPHRSLRSQLVPYRADIPRRIGFRQSASSFLCTDRVEYRIVDHELQRNASLLAAAGFDLEGKSPQSWLVPEESIVELMRERYGGDTHPVVVAPGSVWPTKCWPEEYFADLCCQLIEGEHTVLLVGSEKEGALCERIGARAGLANDSQLAGKLSLPELSALLSIAGRVVTNDSAPLHIAEGVGTPVSTIFGPTVPEFGFAPYLPASSLLQTSLPCRPCGIHGHQSCPIGTHECMQSVSVADVLASITFRDV